MDVEERLTVTQLLLYCLQLLNLNLWFGDLILFDCSVWKIGYYLMLQRLNFLHSTEVNAAIISFLVLGLCVL
jgi:hypothetical protein